MDHHRINIVLFCLAYFAVRMTLISPSQMPSRVLILLRASGLLMFFSIAVADEWVVLNGKPVPVFGVVGFVFYGIALGYWVFYNSTQCAGKHNSQLKPAYTWDMAAVLVVCVTLFIYLSLRMSQGIEVM